MKKDTGIDIDNFSIDEEVAKYSYLKVVGWKIAVRLYQQPEMRNGLLLPPSTRDNDEYNQCVGLVVKMGPGAYKDPRYDQTGPWCQVGEWVAFPRQGGTKYKLEDVPVWIIWDDVVDVGVDDPRKVSR